MRGRRGWGWCEWKGSKVKQREEHKKAQEAKTAFEGRWCLPSLQPVLLLTGHLSFSLFVSEKVDGGPAVAAAALAACWSRCCCARLLLLLLLIPLGPPSSISSRPFCLLHSPCHTLPNPCARAACRCLPVVEGVSPCRPLLNAAAWRGGGEGRRVGIGLGKKRPPHSVAYKEFSKLQQQQQKHSHTGPGNKCVEWMMQ